MCEVEEGPPNSLSSSMSKLLVRDGLEPDRVNKDLGSIQPIDYAVVALKHPPVYNMHRYFARRPHNVFQNLIRHYTNQGSIIIDPFCGGGVTVIEALRERRRVVAIDFNPLATFITRMEVTPVQLEDFKEAFEEIKKEVSKRILSLYETRCPKCARKNYSEWNGWHNKLHCPKCGHEFIIRESKKIGHGIYRCPKCDNDCNARESKVGEEIIGLHFKCECGFDSEKTPDEQDKKVLESIQNTLKDLPKEYSYPKAEIPKGDNTQQILSWGYKYFYETFTPRNLLALSYLLSAIQKFKPNRDIYDIMMLTFGETLTDVTKLVSSVLKGWQAHAYWIPNEMYEINVWYRFERRFNFIFEGKKYSNETIGTYYRPATTFQELESGQATCLILTRFSNDLTPIPQGSIDAVITDPPYGANVNYSEMSDFWSVWLKDVLDQAMLNTDGTIKREKEAVINRSQNKGIEEYRRLLYEVFKECHRVLKRERWMVMTFHNKDPKVWASLHMATHDGGFSLPEDAENLGLQWQPPIKEYTSTIFQKRIGSMLGDFIVSYRRSDERPKYKQIDDLEIGRKVREVAGRIIEYHGGATLSMIYRGLVPFLTQNGLFHKIPQSGVEPILEKEFEEYNGKWYRKEEIDPDTGKPKLLDFVPVNQRIEFVVRSYMTEVKTASLDDIIREVFVNLLNGDAADYDEISEVVRKICQKIEQPEGRPLYKLKDFDQKTLFEVWEKEEIQKETSKQMTLTGEQMQEALTQHDLVLEYVANQGKAMGYDIHIGQTEQRKYRKFKWMSMPMGDLGSGYFGIQPDAYDVVREIDVLWLQEKAIIAGFEIEHTTTIDSGINRFRNLHVALPNLKIKTVLVVPLDRKVEAERKLNSPANRAEHLPERIRILTYDEIKKCGLEID